MPEVKAPQTKLEAMHDQLADTITSALQPREVVVQDAEYDDEGRVTKPERKRLELPSAAVMAVAAKFLKDNSIFSTPEQDEKMEDMRNALHQRALKRKPTAADRNDALAMLTKELLQ